MLSNAGAEILENWELIQHNGLNDSNFTKRIWESFSYRNVLTDDIERTPDHTRRVRRCRVVDILNKTKHRICSMLPHLSEFVRAVDDSLGALGINADMQDFHLLRQVNGQACFNWHLDKHHLACDLALICVMHVRNLRGVEDDVPSRGGVVVYKYPKVQYGDQVCSVFLL